MNDPFSLQDRVVAITGASGLLGRQHAEAVAAAGGALVLLDIQATGLEALGADLRSRFGVEVMTGVVDITDEDQVRDNAARVVAHFGRLDGLINNAANNPKVEGPGGQDFSRLENFPLAVWEADLAVGLRGAYLCAKHHGAAIARNPRGGSILNIASDLGLIAPDQRLYRKPGFAEDQQPVKPVTYSVVKSGLIGLTRYLATYWADRGVRCNALCPGGVENSQAPEFIAQVTQRIPLGRMARPDEYRGAVVFLLSDASSYVTGAVIAADGGRSAW